MNKFIVSRVSVSCSHQQQQQQNNWGGRAINSMKFYSLNSDAINETFIDALFT